MPLKKLATVSATPMDRRIHLVRNQRVMLDSDLAALYGVPTKSLNLAVRRNRTRFPAYFMFRLTQEEDVGLRLQVETSKVGRGGRRYLPYVFTELGVAMLSSVLNGVREPNVKYTGGSPASRKAPSFGGICQLAGGLGGFKNPLICMFSPQSGWRGHSTAVVAIRVSFLVTYRSS